MFRSKLFSGFILPFLRLAFTMACICSMFCFSIFMGGCILFWCAVGSCVDCLWLQIDLLTISQHSNAAFQFLHHVTGFVLFPLFV